MNGASSEEKDTKFSEGNTAANGEAVANSNKKRRIMTEALMLSLNRTIDDIVDDDGKPTKKLSIIADKLVDKAVAGDTKAIEIVFDRTEGKAAQSLKVAGDPENPVPALFSFLPVGAENEQDND